MVPLKKNKSSHKYIFKRPNGILPSGLSLASRPLLGSLPASLLLLKHIYLVPASGPLHLPFSWTGAHFSPITIKSTPSFFFWLLFNVTFLTTLSKAAPPSACFLS